MTCPICLHPSTKTEPLSHGGDGVQIKCISCGQFSLSGTALTLLASFTGERWKASSWIRHNGQGQLFSSENIETLKIAIEPSLQTKALIALRYLSNRHPLGSGFSLRMNDYTVNLHPMNESKNPFNSELGALTWSKNYDALKFLLNEVLVTDLKWLSPRSPDWATISPKGWLALESKQDTQSQIGFCAMWFNDEVKSLWIDCIEPAILNAGYEPLRIDGKQHNNKIDDEIIASIRQAKFVIADLTGNRGGVYYEAGFAHGLGLPVIFMCRRSDADRPHFDIQQYNTIFWSDDEGVQTATGALSKNDAKKVLQMRIESTMSKGTYAPSK